MIVVHVEGALACPVIICDACGKQITESGNAYWLVTGGGTGTVYNRIWHTHKWPCCNFDEELERRHGAGVAFEELDRWLRQILHNFRATGTGA